MENFSDIIKNQEESRQRLLAEFIKSGVKIPYTDRVIIDKEAELEKSCTILPNTQIYGKTKICANAVIGPNTVIENCVIGENAKVISSHCYNSEIKNGAEIGPFVRIRPDCIVGENARIGNFVEVKNSEIKNGAKISHLSYVGDSEVGEEVNIGCGCATVNFDGRNKNRTVICDGAFIGCGVNLIAPVKVGKDAFVAAGSTVTEDVPENSLAIARSRQVNKENWVMRKKPYKRMK